MGTVNRAAPLSPDQLSALAESTARSADIDARHAVERRRDAVESAVTTLTATLLKHLTEARVDVNALERELTELSRKEPAAAHAKALRFARTNRELILHAILEARGRQCY